MGPATASPRVAVGQDHFLALWGVSFSNPAREGGGVSASEWALNKTSELRRHGPWAAGLVKETPRCQEEPGQGQSDPLEKMFSCTETPGVNSENAEMEMCGSLGGGGGAGSIPFLPASQAGWVDGQAIIVQCCLPPSQN